MTVVELRAKCVSRKLSQVGLKQQLIQVRGAWSWGRSGGSGVVQMVVMVWLEAHVPCWPAL